MAEDRVLRRQAAFALMSAPSHSQRIAYHWLLVWSTQFFQGEGDWEGEQGEGDEGRQGERCIALLDPER